MLTVPVDESQHLYLSQPLLSVSVVEDQDWSRDDKDEEEDD